MVSYSDIGLSTSTLLSRGPSWMAENTNTESVTLDADLCLAVYTDGIVPSGAVLAQNTTTKRYGPWAGTSDEVQTLTVGGSGLTSFTVTFGGQTTGAIVAAATAAQVQTALEALSTIGVGNVLVTGSSGGPWTLTFRGALANTDVAQITATPTGGSGTITPATGTAGGAGLGSGGLETAAGHLLGSKVVRAGKHVDAALYYKGEIYDDLLPANSGYDARVKTALGSKIRYKRVGA